MRHSPLGLDTRLRSHGIFSSHVFEQRTFSRPGNSLKSSIGVITNQRWHPVGEQLESVKFPTCPFLVHVDCSFGYECNGRANSHRSRALSKRRFAELLAVSVVGVEKVPISKNRPEISDQECIPSSR
jgi:hypothetical protein